MNRNKSAFTLIELLVVIAIIGILATIAVVALQQARQGARDSKRIADVRQIQTALELYYNNNSSYPDNIDVQIADSDTVYMEMVPIAPTPADGDCDSETNQYVYSAIGEGNSSYTISFCLGSKTGAVELGEQCATPWGIIEGECPFICGSTFIDDRDGKEYKTTKIGDQCWFAEGLRYESEYCIDKEWSWYNTNSEEDFLDWENTGYCAYPVYNGETQYDRSIIYNFNAAIKGSLESGSQGVCPDGWRMPSIEDRDVLFAFIENNAGKLKSTDTCIEGVDPYPCFKDPNTGATDEYGFNLLPDGWLLSTGPPIVIDGDYASFWLSEYLYANGIHHGRRVRFRFSSSSASFLNNGWTSGYTVRCIQG